MRIPAVAATASTATYFTAAAGPRTVAVGTSSTGASTGVAATASTGKGRSGAATGGDAIGTGATAVAATASPGKGRSGAVTDGDTIGPGAAAVAATASTGDGVTATSGAITDDISGVCGGYGVGSGGQGLGPLVYAGIQPLVRLTWFTLRLGSYVGWKWPVALAVYFFASLGAHSRNVSGNAF